VEVTHPGHQTREALKADPQAAVVADKSPVDVLSDDHVFSLRIPSTESLEVGAIEAVGRPLAFDRHGLAAARGEHEI
jgi:hypothetical protein